MSLESRLAKLEKVANIADGQRRAYSHPQLCMMARHIHDHGRAPENWDGVVGPPELTIGVDDPSPADLINATVLAHQLRERNAGLSPGAAFEGALGMIRIARTTAGSAGVGHGTNQQPTSAA